MDEQSDPVDEARVVGGEEGDRLGDLCL